MSKDPQPVLAPFPALRIQGGRPGWIPERAAVEVPFELRLNGRSHTLLMISPQAVEDLARARVPLVGFIRRRRATAFTHPRRVTGFPPLGQKSRQD